MKLTNMPMFGLGTWKILSGNVAPLVYDSIKLGVRNIDCACDYGNEKLVGDGIQRALIDGLCKREELFVVSKLWNTYHAKEHVELACKKTLSDLKLNQLDLYLIHFPIAIRYVPIEKRYPPEWLYDPSAPEPRIEQVNVPIRETWEAMESLVDKGLTKHIGLSNFNVQSIRDILTYARIRPAALQTELHPYLQQQALVNFCQDEDMSVIAYSPLGSSGYVELGLDKQLNVGVLNEPVIKSIAAVHKKTPAQVVLRWNIQRGVCIIPKSSNIDRVRENYAISDFKLSDDEMKEIAKLNRNIRFNDPGDYFTKKIGGPIPIFA